LCLRSLAGPVSPPDVPLHAYLGVGQRRASIGMQLRAIIREWLQLRYAAAMEANAALRSIVRRDSRETYREMLTRMAKEVASRRRRSTTSSNLTTSAMARSRRTRIG